eukprot:jgi/Orpsp1_1/1176807/evm.model.c7180000059111.1
MRGLFIGIHSSCSYNEEPSIYNYIISVNITSFWNQKCSIGNIYFPQNRWPDARLNAFSELDQWLRSHSNINFPAVLVGDFNMPFEKLKKYISKHFPEWTVAKLTGNNITYTKGSKSSYIDHIIYNEAMAPHVHLSSSCTSFTGISDHKPIILSCNKELSKGFMKPKKSLKWSKPICKTKCTDILSHNYFSILANELESSYEESSADDMVKKFINTSYSIGKKIKAFIPMDHKGPAFHCPYYVKKLSNDKHLAYVNIKPFSDCPNVDAYLEQFTQYHKLYKIIKKIKNLASDSSGHSLNSDYWANVFRNNHRNPTTWNINESISYSDIRNTVLSMKSNKAPGPDGIPIEFYKALFLISRYAFTHNYIRPEQFGFRNHEECISLYISIREICQRRKFKGKFTYVAFLDLKKAYDSVPIYNILTKIFHLGIRDKCFNFISKLYLTSKARARYLNMLSDEFPINRGVRQG